MSEYVFAGLTSQSIDILIQDSSSTTGAGLGGLLFNSAGLVASYRKGATGARVAITLATQTVGGAWSSAGFVEIDATHLKGVYRFDIPNAAVDTEGFATLYFYGATNMLPTALRIDCRPLPADVRKFGGSNGTFAAGIPDAKVASVAANAINAAAIADGAIDTATFAAGTTIPRVTLADTVTTNTDMRGTDGANTIAPTNLSALQVRTELATELGRIDASISSRSTFAGGAVASVTAAVELDSASITAVQSGLATAAAVTAMNNLSAAQVTTAVLVSQLTEAYAADGVPPTLTQAVMLILQHLSESSIVSTTKTVKKLDRTTSAATFTLDSATDPTSITRTT